jgi:DNA-binding CsgD family transcriptional regulator
MASEILRFNNPAYSSRLSVATEKLSQLQAELVSEALNRAVEDAGAAVAHQLSEPLTALLYHLHEMKQHGDDREGAETFPAAMREIIDMALREMVCVCDIVERMDQTVRPPVEVETAIARGHQAIDSWTRNHRVAHVDRAAPAMSAISQPVLTPREREVLALIVGGASNREGGHRLGISTRTFEAHRARLMGKAKAKNAAHLVSMALSESL